MGVQYLDLADYLVIAEAVLGIEAEVLALSGNLHLAESALAAPMAAFEGHEFYPSFPEKSAILCARLARNHALLDGNKRVAYECLREFIERNGHTWNAPAGDQAGGDETVDVMVAVASGAMPEREFAEWIAARIGGHE